jgi:hypothetical protein
MKTSKIQKTKFSSHARNHRVDRIVFIATEIGYGETVDNIQIYDVERGYRRVTLTETGVAIIKAMEEEFVITMYCPTQRQLKVWYGSQGAVPIRLWNAAGRNEKKGWTNL